MATKSRAKAIPKWRPAPEALVQQFGRAIEGLPAVEPRKMFGYPAVFLNGNMFAGLFQESVVLRLSAEDRGALSGATPFEPMPGRAMREYIVAPVSVVSSTTELRGWLERARNFVASLPPKQPARKTTKARANKKSKPRLEGR